MKEIQITKENEYLIDELFGEALVEALSIFDEFGTQIDGFKLLRRISDGTDINVVSEMYDLVQHENYITPFIKQFLDKDDYSIEVFIENQEKRNRVICKITSKDEIIIDGEAYSKTIIVANSADGSMSKKIIAGLFRWVCSNMQFNGTSISMGSKKHIKSSEKSLQSSKDSDDHDTFSMEDIAAEIESRLETIVDMILEMKKIPYNATVNKFEEKLVKDKIIPKKLMENPFAFFEQKEIFVPSADYDRIKSPATLFDLYQKVTLWSTPVVFKENITRGINVNKQIFNVFNGFISGILNKD